MALATETFSAIALSELQPGAPVTSEVGLRLRANPLAIAEGASGAQRVYLGAFERVTAGATQRALNDTVTNIVASTFTDLWSFTVLQGGSLRFAVTARTNSGGTAESRVLRTRAGSGSNFTIISTSSGTYNSNSADVDVSPGDLITVQGRDTGGSPNSDFKDITVSTDGEDLFPGAGLGGWINANTALT